MFVIVVSFFTYIYISQGIEPQLRCGEIYNNPMLIIAKCPQTKPAKEF